MFDPITAGIGLVSALPSIVSGFQQRKAARNLKLQNTETPEEREQLGMSRQAATTARLPGIGQMQGRLGMVQAGAVQNARMGAASSSDFLASAGAADARRMQGEQDLGMRGLAYQDQSKMQLRRDLTTASNRRQKDLDTFNNTKAALTQSSATNLNNGVQTAAAFGAEARNTAMGLQGADAAGNMGQLADVGYDPMASRLPNLQMGEGSFSPPVMVSNPLGRPPGLPGMGSRRYNRLGYNPTF